MEAGLALAADSCEPHLGPLGGHGHVNKAGRMEEETKSGCP